MCLNTEHDGSFLVLSFMPGLKPLALLFIALLVLSFVPGLKPLALTFHCSPGAFFYA